MVSFDITMLMLSRSRRLLACSVRLKDESLLHRTFLNWKLFSFSSLHPPACCLCVQIITESKLRTLCYWYFRNFVFITVSFFLFPFRFTSRRLRHVYLHSIFRKRRDILVGIANGELTTTFDVSLQRSRGNLQLKLMSNEILLICMRFMLILFEIIARPFCCCSFQVSSVN